MTDRTSIGCARDVSIKLFFSSQTLVEWKKTKAQQRPGGGGHTKWQQWRRKSNVCTQKEEESQTFSFFFSRFGQNETPGSSSSAAELGRDLTCCRSCYK